MNKRNRFKTLAITAVFAAGVACGSLLQLSGDAVAQSSGRVFELRTYTTLPGRLDALHARFADHTMALFERHGMTNVAYFNPQDEPLRQNTLTYLIAHDSRSAADANWQAFAADPDWKQVAEDSQRDGRIVEKVERVYLDATDYSPLK